MILIDHAPINQPSGSHDYGPFSVPDGATGATLRLARCTTATPTFWPNASTAVDAKVWLSFDGGTTYPTQLIHVTSAGGIIVHPDTGSEVTETGVSVSNVKLGTGRKVKATFNVTNGPWVSQATLEVS